MSRVLKQGRGLCWQTPFRAMHHLLNHSIARFHPECSVEVSPNAALHHCCTLP